MRKKVLQMRKFCFSLIVFCSLASISYGQKLLFHKSRHREAIYKKGDKISFRLKNAKSKITGQIIGFEDSVIAFQGFKINPEQISHLYVDSKTKIWYVMRYKYEKIFLIAGIGYSFLELVNEGEVDKETLIISGSLITVGLLARWLISDKIKIKGRRRLLIID
ncbi:MAG TPA: hypothetical protein PLJ60_17605 [Chryseolinea sp.]|nr:hypothetical protein [Chryseolinea sp.]